MEVIITNNGVREIVLLGQNVNAFNDTNTINPTSLSKLIDKIATNDKIKRIRYTTSHPNNMDSDLIKTHANNEKHAFLTSASSIRIKQDFTNDE